MIKTCRLSNQRNSLGRFCLDACFSGQLGQENHPQNPTDPIKAQPLQLLPRRCQNQPAPQLRTATSGTLSPSSSRSQVAEGSQCRPQRECSKNVIVHSETPTCVSSTQSTVDTVTSKTRLERGQGPGRPGPRRPC